jgi:hypothetical protein
MFFIRVIRYPQLPFFANPRPCFDVFVFKNARLGENEGIFFKNRVASPFCLPRVLHGFFGGKSRLVKVRITRFKNCKLGESFLSK